MEFPCIRNGSQSDCTVPQGKVLEHGKIHTVERRLSEGEGEEMSF
jgi:hypothetical protein